MWSNAEERAMELKRQQQFRREMEWNSRPEYEKRQQVISIDLVGNKVVKKMIAKERPGTPEGGGSLDNGVLLESSGNRSIAGHEEGDGVYSKNPMGRAVMKPGFEFKGKGDEESRALPKWSSTRVQDLDTLAVQKAVDIGGEVLGLGLEAGTMAGDEPDCG
jgi:hypothetical protein